MLILPAARFWLAWSEMSFHAAITIVLRSSMLTSSFLTQGPAPAAECWKMAAEKQLAVVEAAAEWMALMRRQRLLSPLDVGAAILRPYRRRTRANARRLSRPAKR